MPRSSDRKLDRKLSLYLDEDTVRKLKHRAFEERCPANDLIVAAIDRYLQPTAAPAHADQPVTAIEKSDPAGQKPGDKQQCSPETSDLLKTIDRLIDIIAQREAVTPPTDPTQPAYQRFLPAMTWAEQQALLGWHQNTAINFAIGILCNVMEKRQEPLAKEHALSILIDQRDKRAPNRIPSLHVDAVVQEGVDRGVWVELDNGRFWLSHLYPLDDGRRNEGMLPRFGG